MGRDHLTRKAFSNRVYWAQRSINGGTALPLFLEARAMARLWVRSRSTISAAALRKRHAGLLDRPAPMPRRAICVRRLQAMVHYAFTHLDLSRIEAACLPENTASRRGSGTTGFKYEGVAQAICRLTGDGGTMSSMQICAVTGAGGQQRARCSSQLVHAIRATGVYVYQPLQLMRSAEAHPVDYLLQDQSAPNPTLPPLLM